MKKLGLVIALVAVGLLTSKSYADVQNIRLSGDIRIRGYFLGHADSNNREDQNFISQRTRVTCEADLEDHVLVVVTLKAESLWGNGDETANSAGAGLGAGVGTINRSFAVGIDQAYVQLSEVFYTPATLKIGRQYLNYGRGLILSSAEQEYNFDAARLVLDYYPLTIDLVWARTIENASFGTGNGNINAANLLFANARYEMTDSLLKDIEAYVGWLANENASNTGVTRVPPVNTVGGGASPVIIGLRADLNLTKGLQTWMEAVYECGSDGSAHDQGINAGLVNVGGNYTVQDCQWAPAFNLGYTYATGGGEDSKHTFRPWFDYGDGYNGYVFHPRLSNIHIFNMGVAVKPAKNVTLSEQVYYYLKADDDVTALANPVNRNVDFGTMGVTPVPGDKELGWELDTILGYDYSKDVRCQLVYGVFLPERALRNAGFDSVAHEIRGELNVKF